MMRIRLTTGGKKVCFFFVAFEDVLFEILQCQPSLAVLGLVGLFQDVAGAQQIGFVRGHHSQKEALPMRQLLPKSGSHRSGTKFRKCATHTREHTSVDGMQMKQQLEHKERSNSHNYLSHLPVTPNCTTCANLLKGFRTRNERTYCSSVCPLLCPGSLSSATYDHSHEEMTTLEDVCDQNISFPSATRTQYMSWEDSWQHFLAKLVES